MTEETQQLRDLILTLAALAVSDVTIQPDNRDFFEGRALLVTHYAKSVGITQEEIEAAAAEEVEAALDDNHYV